MLTWQSHLDKLSSILNSATYIIRTLKPVLTLNQQIIYYSYVHSIISYGIIFWGNSSHSNIIFKIQKRIIRIITHTHHRTSCRDLFKNLNILPLQSQYVLSLAMFVIENLGEFVTNSDIHSLNSVAFSRRANHTDSPSTHAKNPTYTPHQYQRLKAKKESNTWVLRYLINSPPKFSPCLLTKSNFIRH